MTRLAIWWHRKRHAHHTLTYWRESPVSVRCQSCGRQWSLGN